MSKKGQHKNDAFDQTKSPGGNKPERSQKITTGTYKKQETYGRQAAGHSGKTADAAPQTAKNEWGEDRLDRPRHEDLRTRARDESIRGGRSGSDSNATPSTRAG